VASTALRVFQVGSSLARGIPRPLLDATVRWGSLSLAPLAGDRREQVERNLRRVHGPGFRGFALRRAVAATFESYARYWVESFKLPDTEPAVIERGLVAEGWEQVVAAREAGNGAIIALPHLGGWEWAAMWATRCRSIPLTVVVEALEPPDVYEWFVALREGLGMTVVPLGPRAGTEVLNALRDNHVVCLLCDRDISGGGIEVDFFGERTTLPGGPATLAVRSGAPLFPTAIYFEGRSGHRGVVRPPLDTARRGKLRDDVQRITQDLADELEGLIRRAPEQWHLLQPNWPSDPGYHR
jgi:lauroyl/myristoyl acyltransferase